MGGKSLEVDVLAGAGLANLSGCSMKRTLQPRYTSHTRTGGVGYGCRASTKMAKASVNGEGTAIGNRLVHRGTEGGTEGKDMRSKLGSPSPYKVVGQRPIVVMDKSMGGSRVSDEAIVSDDSMGPHNPLASQHVGKPTRWSAKGLWTGVLLAILKGVPLELRSRLRKNQQCWGDTPL